MIPRRASLVWDGENRGEKTFYAKPFSSVVTGKKRWKPLLWRGVENKKVITVSQFGNVLMLCNVLTNEGAFFKFDYQTYYVFLDNTVRL